MSDTKTKAFMYNPYSTYLDSQVLSATPLQLIQLAYEGASEAVRQARIHLSAKQIFERSRAISKAQEILAELSRSLDFAAGGDMSVRLAALYDYMQRRLTEANQQQIEAPLEEVENLLATLSEGWKEVARTEVQTAAVTTASAPAGSNGDPAFSAPSWALPASEAPNRSSFSYSL